MGKIIKVSDDIFDKQLEQLPKEVTFCNFKPASEDKMGIERGWCLFCL